MALVATGLSNDEIAERLFVSTATAKTHVNRAMTKLGARDRGPAGGVRLRVGPGAAGAADTPGHTPRWDRVAASCASSAAAG